MKASEITQPGLYWCRIQGGRCEPVEVFYPPLDSEYGRMLYFGRLSDDGGWTSDVLPDDLAAGDFIGPFPPPGEGPKFEGFKAALEALCQAYGVAIEISCVHTPGFMYVYDASRNTTDPLPAEIEDCTKPVTG